MSAFKIRAMLSIGCLCIVSITPALAQWPAGDGLAVADRGDQGNLAKIHPTPDGGWYISWFDNADGGYDVYLQRFDAAGYEQWPHNGRLIADRDFDWTMDYGLDVDEAGNAILVFRDTRFGGERITVTKVAPDGTQPWGAGGVQLSGVADSIATPFVAVTAEGSIVAAWTQDSSDTGLGELRLQKLNGDGVAQWLTPMRLADVSGGNFFLSDLKAADDGGVIVSWVRRGPNYYDPKHIWAQKIAEDGSLLWAAAHARVFDNASGSLQFGNFPRFETDGSGGAVFSWYYIVGNAINVAAQHIRTNGTEAFAHNGALPSTDTTRLRAEPAVSFNPATAETFVFWVEANSTQSQNGLYGQKFNATGARQWGNQGKVFIPVGADDIWGVAQVRYGTGAMAFWFQTTTTVENGLRGMRVDGVGNYLWTPTIKNITTTSSSKMRLETAIADDGPALLAWTDGRDGDDDIYAQNIFPNGVMGGCLADLDFDGVVNISDLAALLSNYGTVSGAEFADGDLDGDGDVELGDLAQLLAWYGQGCN
jgi:hypothetical protein